MPTPRNPRPAAADSTAVSRLKRRTIPIAEVTAEADVAPFTLPKEPLEAIVDAGSYSLERPRDGEYLHVSDLLGKCIRLKSLSKSEGIALPARRLTMSEMLTFRQGTAIHDVLKERAAVGGADHVWGKWKCQCGNLRIDEPCLASEVDKEFVCEYCEGYADQYIEVTMRDEEHMIQGHPDLILLLPRINRFYVTELKSIAANQFDDLSRPAPDHVLQVVFYWWLMRRLGHKMVDQVAIMYVTKGHTFRGKPYKVFTITPSQEVHRLDDYLREAIAYARNRRGESEDPPARTFCASSADPQARKCPLVDVCFGVKRNEGTVLSYADAIKGSSSRVARTVRTAGSGSATAVRQIRARPRN